jgi:hypothetical protein
VTGGATRASPGLAALGGALLLLVMALAPACGDERRLVIVLHGEVDEDAVRVEAIVLRPGPAFACSDVLAETDHVEFPDAVSRADFDPSSPPGLGHLGEGRFLMLVRAWSRGCRLAQACQEFEVVDGVEDDVRLELRQFLALGSSCPAETQCDDGLCTRCFDCCLETDCNDGDPATSDACVAGMCTTSDDLDRDGFPATDDCDDRRPAVRPGALIECGEALDFDCDGVIDDLEGCAAPECWLGTVTDMDLRADLVARAVAPAGDVVAAAVDDAAGGTSLWLGRLVGGALVDLSTLRLVGTEIGFRPRDLTVLGETAFVLTTDPSTVRVVDISVPEAPVELAPILLDSATGRDTRSLTIAPPLLWVARSMGVDVYDVSQIGPTGGWPDLVAVGVDPTNGADSRHLISRSGQAYLLAERAQVSCASLESTVAVPAAFVSCFDAAPDHEGSIFSAGHVTAEQELFLASARAGAIGPPPLLWRVPLDANGLPSAVGVRVVEVTGAPTHLIVAGGTIFRSTNHGLFLHPRADFDLGDEPPWTQVDLDSNAVTPGPEVLEAAPFGSSVVLAGGDAGLAVLTLECRDGGS